MSLSEDAQAMAATTTKTDSLPAQGQRFHRIMVLP
jgi:hypothetical protein